MNKTKNFNVSESTKNVSSYISEFINLGNLKNVNKMQNQLKNILKCTPLSENSEKIELNLESKVANKIKLSEWIN